MKGFEGGGEGCSLFGLPCEVNERAVAKTLELEAVGRTSRSGCNQYPQ